MTMVVYESPPEVDDNIIVPEVGFYDACYVRRSGIGNAILG
jgi:hypothetical protein